MRKSKALNVLRTQLADLISDSNLIRVLVSDSELNQAEINFDGPVVTVWQSVLVVADRTNKLASLVEIVGQWFPMQAVTLEQAYQDYRNATRDPPLLRFWFTLTSLTILTSFVGFGIWYSLNWIEPMTPTGSFNIAVAQIPILDSPERRIANCLSLAISDWIYQTVLDSPNSAQAQLLTDSRSPGDMGVLRGNWPDQQREAAAALAERINATILVYGVISAQEDQYLFQPEFYLSAAESSFNYASEIAGPNRLGAPVPFTLPPASTCDTLDIQQLSNLNRVLAERLLALRYVVAGLRHFYAGEFELAHARFEQGTMLPTWPPNATGQEVIQLLMGAAQLCLYEPAADPVKAEQALQTAHQAFQKAADLNPEYGRAFLGLGIVALEEAKVYNQSGTELMPALNLPELYLATEWFTRSLNASDQPTQAYIPAKAAWGSGVAHLLGFERGAPGWSGQEAFDHFQLILDEYKVDQSPGLLPTVALAHENLGRLAGHNQQWDEMVNEYTQAIQLLERPGVLTNLQAIARYWRQIAHAYERKGEICLAITNLERA